MKKGFTLIELMVVISIIAVLSSIILAAVSTTRAKASVAAGQVFDNQMYQAYGAQAVAIWNFDDGSGTTAKDSSGSNNALTLDTSGVHPLAWTTPAQAFRGNSAIAIPINNSVNDPATVDLSGFNPANGSLTFWLNLTSYSNQAGIFCNSSSPNSAAGTNNQFCVYDADSSTSGHFIQVYWNFGNIGSGNITSTISADSILNKWTNVALSWSGSTIKIYINGTQTNSSSAYTPGVSFPSPSSPYYFCIAGDCGGDNIIGTLDEMRVYSQSLQTGDIEKLYAEELPRHEHLLADNLIIYRR